MRGFNIKPLGLFYPKNFDGCSYVYLLYHHSRLFSTKLCRTDQHSSYLASFTGPCLNLMIVHTRSQMPLLIPVQRRRKTMIIVLPLPNMDFTLFPLVLAVKIRVIRIISVTLSAGYVVAPVDGDDCCCFLLLF